MCPLNMTVERKHCLIPLRVELSGVDIASSEIAQNSFGRPNVGFDIVQDSSIHVEEDSYWKC